MEDKMMEIDQEISNLKYWFDKYYTEHEQKFRRLISLNITEDDGVNVSKELEKLYQQAEVNRKRIQELEVQAKNISGGDEVSSSW